MERISIAGAEDTFIVEGMFKISSEEDVRKFGETLAKVTNGCDFNLIGRTNYSFLTGMMDFIIECRSAKLGYENPGWYYVVGRFTDSGFETSEEFFELPSE